MKRILKSLLLPAVALLASCASLKTGTDSFIKNEYTLDSVHVKGTVKKFHDTDREAYAKELVAMLEAETAVKKVFMTEVFSASATNIGPGMVCAYFMGEPVSPDNEVERQTMTRILEAK